MKRKIYGTALFLSIVSLSFATYSLISQKKTSIQNVENTPASAPEKTTDKAEFPRELKDDLKRINSAHAQLDNIKITNHYTIVTTSKGSKETVEESEFSLSRKGKNLICDAGGLKRIQGNKYNILVNEPLKMILVFDPDKGLGWYMKEALKNFDPDSSLLLADKAQKLTAPKGHTIYAIYYSMMPYSRMDIDFDPETNLLQNITYYYTNFDKEDEIQKKKITISMQYEKLTSASASLFDTRKFFSVKKGEFTPSALYSGYTIYNNMKE